MLQRKAFVEDSRPVSGVSIRDFTDLDAWKHARDLRCSVYKMAGTLPSNEKYALANQLRRAAISVTANIAEGYGRFSYRENVQFCRQARGSAYEIRDHLISAADAGYIPEQTRKELDAKAQRAIRILNGYIRSTNTLARQSAPQR